MNTWAKNSFFISSLSAYFFTEKKYAADLRIAILQSRKRECFGSCTFIESQIEERANVAEISTRINATEQD